MANEFTEPLGVGGALLPEEVARIQKFLTENLKNPCPSCGRHEFTLDEHVWVAPMMMPTRFIDMKQSYPMVMVVCGNCGYVLPFAARRLGLYRPIPAEKKDE